MSEVRDRVAAAYRARWGVAPDRVLFAPGRINLIGDHTDYSLLPVLPLAIQKGIGFAVGKAPTGITIDSLDEPAELVVGTPPPAAASWHPYAEFAAAPLLAQIGGTRVLFGGDLPSTGGLSSSSALVVGLLASITAAGPTPLAGQALVDAALDAERRAAIEGGAMDQTVIVFAQAGAALRIDFDPPSHRAVALPPDLVLVAANSGERAAKGAAARDAYNARVVGCRCATALLAEALGRAQPAPLVLRSLQDAPPGEVAALPECASAATTSQRTGVPVARLAGLAAGDFPSDREVPIRAVARHVLWEGRAVAAAARALREGDLEGLGDLLNRSHQSLRTFGSSTPALDELVDAMMAAGALGARVTGAGFGGYAVAACREASVEAVLAAAHRSRGAPAFRVVATRGVG